MWANFSLPRSPGTMPLQPMQTLEFALVRDQPISLWQAMGVDRVVRREIAPMLHDAEARAGLLLRRQERGDGGMYGLCRGGGQ